MEVPTTPPIPQPYNFPLPDPQWVSKKMRPTSLGDSKHVHKLAYWDAEAKALRDKLTANATAEGMKTLQAETIISDDGKVPKAIAVDSAFPDNAILIIDDKKETQ